MPLAYKQAILKAKLWERIAGCVISWCPFFCPVSGEVTGNCFKNLSYQSSGSTQSRVCVLVNSRWPFLKISQSYVKSRVYGHEGNSGYGVLLVCFALVCRLPFSLISDNSFHSHSPGHTLQAAINEKSEGVSSKGGSCRTFQVTGEILSLSTILPFSFPSFVGSQLKLLYWCRRFITYHALAARTQFSISRMDWGKDRLHNLLGSVQSENVGPCIKKDYEEFRDGDSKIVNKVWGPSR